MMSENWKSYLKRIKKMHLQFYIIARANLPLPRAFKQREMKNLKRMGYKKNKNMLSYLIIMFRSKIKVMKFNSTDEIQ